MRLPVVRCTLVRLVLLHQRDELLRLPPLSLEVVVIRSRSTSVHLQKMGDIQTVSNLVMV